MVSKWLQFETVPENISFQSTECLSKLWKDISLQKKQDRHLPPEVTKVCTLVWAPPLVAFHFFVLNRNCSQKLPSTPGPPAGALPRACFFLSGCHTSLSLSPEQRIHLPQVPELNRIILSCNYPEKNEVIWGHLFKVEKPEPPTCSCSSKSNLPSAELLENVPLSHLKAYSSYIQQSTTLTRDINLATITELLHKVFSSLENDLSSHLKMLLAMFHICTSLTKRTFCNVTNHIILLTVKIFSE